VPEHVPLGAAFAVKPALAFFLPVQVEHSVNLGLVAMPRPTRGSGDFISLLGSDGFVELPPGPREFPAGFVAPLYRW
jgi:molybdopterin biosynthesis enzyme